MVSAPTVQILLATYNEAKFLGEFLESLAAQTETRWGILVRDDGSADGTQDLLLQWREHFGDQLIILPDSGRSNLGVAGNFSRLLAASTSRYVMFANPDDVWHSDKIAITLNAMQAAEARAGVAVPCLVHTDLRMVDGHLRPLAPSFRRYQGLFPKRSNNVSMVFVENTVWACTTMLNRALVELAGEIPAESHHEDWWAAMVGAAFGIIVALPEQTIDWRRHGGNDSDVSEFSTATGAALLSPRQARERLRNLLGAGRPRVQVFLTRYRERMHPRQIAAAEAFLALDTMGPIRRRWAVLRHRLLFTSWWRNLGMLVLL
jgi:glycosyltransferase involved in cell wall biosynthesis